MLAGWLVCLPALFTPVKSGERLVVCNQIRLLEPRNDVRGLPFIKSRIVAEFKLSQICLCGIYSLPRRYIGKSSACYWFRCVH
ncbi:hypothetical protein F5B20DRAFT_532290 [Whalleya microplaca]|nr:hypothetical protein F5B20DRAFT_532290 [Whalleya microplaca]